MEYEPEKVLRVRHQTHYEVDQPVQIQKRLQQAH
jgi:hypothetical protein